MSFIKMVKTKLASVYAMNFSPGLVAETLAEYLRSSFLEVNLTEWAPARKLTIRIAGLVCSGQSAGDKARRSLVDSSLAECDIFSLQVTIA